MQPVKRNQSFNRLFMPGRNRWPWDLAGSSWLTIRHVTLAEATISSPDPKQEARCELLPPPTLLLYSQYTRLQAVLGTLHYNCIVWHPCVFLMTQAHIYISTGSSWAMGCSSAALQLPNYYHNKHRLGSVHHLLGFTDFSFRVRGFC